VSKILSKICASDILSALTNQRTASPASKRTTCPLPSATLTRAHSHTYGTSHAAIMQAISGNNHQHHTRSSAASKKETRA
jgi:hypothetical protein